MFARILIIATHTPDETDWVARLSRTCAQLGHAVRIWCLPELYAQSAFSAVRDAFRPTLALWTTKAAKACEGDALTGLVRRACTTGLLALQPPKAVPEEMDFIMAVGGICRKSTERVLENAADSSRPAIVALDACVDAAYMQAGVSDPASVRGGASFDQVCTPQRQAVADAARRATGSDPLCFHPTWPESLDAVHPKANLPYWRRKPSFYVACEGHDAASEAQCALRVAEGSILFVENKDGEGAAQDGSPFFEAVEFSDAEELERTMARLAENPDERRSVQTRQHAALAGRGTLESAVRFSLERIEDIAHRCGRPSVCSQSEPALKVVMYGWFGARNFGDDLLLTSTVARIEKRHPNAFFCVIGANASVIEHEYGFQATTPDRKYEVRSFLDQARAMVLCGGLLFDDPLAQTAGDVEFCLDPWIEPTGQAAFCLLGRSLGVPSVYLGFGAGPIDNLPTRVAVNLIARSGAVFLPRDVHTAELLALCDVDERQVRVCADLILGAEAYVTNKAAACEAPGEDKPFFTVSLRHWHRNPPDFARNIARAIDAVTRETGLEALLLPFDSDDVSLHREVVSHMERPEKARLLEHRPEEAELLSILTRSRFAFAMRLHCSILHHILGKPAVGLNYNDKIEAHFRRFEQHDLLLELDAAPDAMAHALGRAAHWGRDDADRLASRRKEAALLVDSAFEELFAAIEKPLPRPTGAAVYFPRRTSNAEASLSEELAASQSRVEAIDRQRRCLEEENAALRAEIEAVRTSRSYRFGNAFMRIPHAVAARLAARKR